jgi:Brp/Blh family beta-carotene 15,15'-monooxygenase
MVISPLRLQGSIFSVLALLVSIFSMLLVPMEPHHEWLLASGLIVLLGVPHGALDPLFAQALPQLNSRTSWFVFVACYLLLAALVVVLWWQSPLVFLIAFLAVSILHFSGDLLAGATFLERLVYGGLIIVLPALVHAAELTRLFSQLVGLSAAVTVVAVLELIAWPWLLALLLVVVLRGRRDGLLALEMMAVGLLALTATPLLGFAIYFCAMHSPRHILRTQQYADVTPMRLVLVAVLPMLATLLLGGLAWHFLPASATDERMLKLLFVALAALTFPHMLLVERVRFSGWRKRALPASMPT